MQMTLGGDCEAAFNANDTAQQREMMGRMDGGGALEQYSKELAQELDDEQGGDVALNDRQKENASVVYVHVAVGGGAGG